MGRPAGSPNKVTAEVKRVAQKYGPQAVKRLAQLGGLIDGKPGAESEQAQVSACREILDRAYGKATQHVAGDPDGAPIKAEIKVTFV